MGAKLRRSTRGLRSNAGRRIAVGAVLTVLAVGTVCAASPPTRAPAVQAVMECARISDPGQRLTCFDAAVAAMTKAEAAGDLVTIDREQRRAARRQAFGLALPSLAFLDRGERPEEVNRITGKVAAVARTPEGKWVITLEGGAVWRQIDDNELTHDPHAGSEVRIRRAALGSFFVNIDREQALRMHRDN
ncbi:MAG TPA: hypothetical protein VII63_10385 [Caulobacteraceae bacterium]